jgi:glycosyltransferase involved in cell wall biosynthesis/GT2 family glycosyltransferase
MSFSPVTPMPPELRQIIASAILKGALGHEPDDNQLAWALGRAADCESLEDFVHRIATTVSTHHLKQLARNAITLEAELALLHASFFWKASGPLRALAARIPASMRQRLRAALARVYRLWTAFPRTAATAVAPSETPVAVKENESPPPALPIYTIPSVDPEAARSRASKWCTDKSPQVSIIINTKDDEATALACIHHVWANTAGISYELIVADNGSDSNSLASFSNLSPGTRLIALGVDRFRGESRNIAAESAVGRYLCFLDDTAFVQEDWLTSLLATWNDCQGDTQAGAVGPKLIAPDGRLLEAGSTIDARGEFHGLDTGESNTTPKLVDNVSGAAMLVARDVFLYVGGFDLTYEPAGYEDADFCLKLLLIGLRVACCSDATVIQVETAAAAQARQSKLHHTAAKLNRQKFLARWAPYLRTRDEADLKPLYRLLPAAHDPSFTAAKREAGGYEARRSVAIYTPYDFRPGGGERYILSLASAFARNSDTCLITAHPYSRLRFTALAKEFGLDLSRCGLTSFAEFARGDCYDLMIVLGNNVIPPIRARARASWYACQFPFPMDPAEVSQRRDILEKYRGVLVYSEFVKHHVIRTLQQHDLGPLPVKILSPPVPSFAGDAARKKPMILSVGRFFSGGHNKRQDAMIEMFREVAHRHSGEIELHFVGSSLPDRYNMEYLETIAENAVGLPIKFHINPSASELGDLYRDAAVYWHAAGLDADLNRQPEKAEHFGISIIEAMSAEAVPIVFAAGGPKEIVKHGSDGYLYSSREACVELTLILLQQDAEARRIAMGRAAARSATTYTVDRFNERALELLGFS